MIKIACFLNNRILLILFVSFFKGRVYSQKIQTDRVEMLYWLQQERRQQALDAAKHVPPTSEVKGMTPVVCQDITTSIA